MPPTTFTPPQLELLKEWAEDFSGASREERQNIYAQVNFEFGRLKTDRTKEQKASDHKRIETWFSNNCRSQQGQRPFRFFRQPRYNWRSVLVHKHSEQVEEIVSQRSGALPGSTEYMSHFQLGVTEVAEELEKTMPGMRAEYQALAEEWNTKEPPEALKRKFADGDAIRAITAFQEMMLKQAGMMVILATSHVSADGTALVALHDAPQQKDKILYKAKYKNWPETKFWRTFECYSSYYWDLDVDFNEYHERGAKKKRIPVQLDVNEKGYPVFDWDPSCPGTVLEQKETLRSFMNLAYAHKAGKPGVSLPWSQLIRDPGALIPPAYLPEGFRFTQDPSKMKGEEVNALLSHFKAACDAGDVPIDFKMPDKVCNRLAPGARSRGDTKKAVVKNKTGKVQTSLLQHYPDRGKIGSTSKQRKRLDIELYRSDDGSSDEDVSEASSDPADTQPVIDHSSPAPCGEGPDVNESDANEESTARSGDAEDASAAPASSVSKLSNSLSTRGTEGVDAMLNKSLSHAPTDLAATSSYLQPGNRPELGASAERHDPSTADTSELQGVAYLKVQLTIFNDVPRLTGNNDLSPLDAKDLFHGRARYINRKPPALYCSLPQRRWLYVIDVSPLPHLTDICSKWRRVEECGSELTGLGPGTPDWLTWTSADRFLPPDVHTPSGYHKMCSWISSYPFLSADRKAWNGTKAVQLYLFALAWIAREMFWISECRSALDRSVPADIPDGVPDYILRSPWKNSVLEIVGIVTQVLAALLEDVKGISQDMVTWNQLSNSFQTKIQDFELEISSEETDEQTFHECAAKPGSQTVQSTHEVTEVSGERSKRKRGRDDEDTGRRQRAYVLLPPVKRSGRLASAIGMSGNGKNSEIDAIPRRSLRIAVGDRGRICRKTHRRI